MKFKQHENQILIFTFIVVSLIAHFNQWYRYRILKKNLEYLYTQTNIINNAAIKTAKILEAHLDDVIKLKGRMQ